MKLVSTLQISIVLGVISCQAFSQLPSFNKKCTDKIKTPSKHRGYLFDENCEHIFILPPSTADLVIEGSSIDVLELECKPVRDAMNGIKSVVNLPSFKRIQLENELRENERNLDYLRLKLEKMKRRKSMLTQKYDRCIEEKGYCDLIEMRISKIDHDIIENEFQINSFQDVVTKVKNQLGGDLIEREPIIKDQRGAGPELISQLDRLRSTSGGSLKFSLNNTYLSLVNKFKWLNPNKSIQSLQPSYFLSSSFLGQDGGASGVIEMHIPSVGVRPKGVELVGTEHTLLGNGLGGILSFSKFVACKYGRNLNAIINSIQFNAYFVYTSSLNVDYEISFNQKEIFKYVKENTSKKGFFSRKSLSKITRELSHSKSLVMNFDIDDPNSILNNFDVQSKIKESFIANMVNSEVVRYVSEEDAKSMKIPELPKENGAKTLGNTVSKFCPHVYCQIGGAVLNLASDLFGSTSASTAYLSRMDRVITESSSHNKAQYNYGVTKFKLKGGR